MLGTLLSQSHNLSIEVIWVAYKDGDSVFSGFAFRRLVHPRLVLRRHGHVQVHGQQRVRPRHEGDLRLPVGGKMELLIIKKF